MNDGVEYCDDDKDKAMRGNQILKELSSLSVKSKMNIQISSVVS